MIILKEAEPHELPAIPKLLAQKGVYELDDRMTRTGKNKTVKVTIKGTKKNEMARQTTLLMGMVL